VKDLKPHVVVVVEVVVVVVDVVVDADAGSKFGFCVSFKNFFSYV
jgi:hypothetical protein